MTEIKKIPVTSSNIEAIGYDQKTETLRIWFKSGIYDYAKVPQSVYDELKDSKSIGSYVGTHIKGKYSFALCHLCDELSALKNKA